MFQTLNSSIGRIFSALPVIVLIFIFILIGSVVYFLYSTKRSNCFQSCYLYYGRVKHTRLKGGAVHSFSYPICFSFLNIDEVSFMRWEYWPFFMLNAGNFSFSSLENKHHLTDQASNETENTINKNSFDLPQRVRDYIKKCTNKQEIKSIYILTHLTYFGYCFNPITIYYINYNISGNDDKFKLHGKENIIVEVSNTPWIEQHSYMLDESVENVKINRRNDDGVFEASWVKQFHVSPFMEMDYQYKFEFSKPLETVWVNSRMIKLTTKEVWFTANFELKRLEFTPINILYILIFYPLHTRIIQVLIHWEALQLWWKGVPTFEHPNNPDLHFGFGITDKTLLNYADKISRWYLYMKNVFLKL